MTSLSLQIIRHLQNTNCSRKLLNVRLSISIHKLILTHNFRLERYFHEPLSIIDGHIRTIQTSGTSLILIPDHKCVVYHRFYHSISSWVAFISYCMCFIGQYLREKSSYALTHNQVCHYYVQQKCTAPAPALITRYLQNTECQCKTQLHTATFFFFFHVISGYFHSIPRIMQRHLSY